MMNEPKLCLATWNIHMGVGLDGRRDLARIVRVIKEMSPDLLGLQEVDNHMGPEGDDITMLRTMTGMEVIAGPTRLRASGDYGNALLTCLPVRDVERYDISFKKREPRGILIVHVDWFGETLQVAVTHLGLLPQERRTQVRSLIEYLSKKNRTPLILMGDFNEWLFWGRPLRWLHRHFGHFHSPATFPFRYPVFRLDHILSDPPERIWSRIVFKNATSLIASDHLPLLATYTR
ncbi:MAG: endonuclease/exonuclease/phosphatase family protein [Deltaproteobacteria bacterium]|nr:endonuclease/exonuclease/phosphatase family protein [Deltaproteobacteria bacterium]